MVPSFLNIIPQFIILKGIHIPGTELNLIGTRAAPEIIEAIDDGRVGCYVTDFPNAKPVSAPRIIAIPHLGASTPESEDNCASMAAQEIVGYLENGNISNSVNMPSAVLPRTNDPRICVIHKNIPDMISKITGAVSAMGINIENMVNASTKGRMQAYTIIDVQALAPGLEDKIKSVEGVIRVRTIC
jgi:D-3-phosphoglycerate dehydrogenase